MTKRITLLLVLLLSSSQLFATIDVSTVIDATWNEVLSGSQFDPGQDTQANSAIDLLGGTSPLLYMKYDDGGTPGASNTSDDEIGFRFRADNVIKSGNYNGVAWIGIDVDSDATIDAFMLLEGKNGTTTLDVYDAGTGANNSPSTTSLGSVSISITTGFVSSHGLVSVIDPTSSSDVDADSDPDYIISFKVNFDALAAALSTQTSTTITIDTAFKFVIASAVNSNTLNGDIGGFDSTSDQSTTYADQGAFTSEISASSGGDVTAPLTPTVDLLAASDLGTSDTDNNTSDTTPTLRVSLDQTGEIATNAIEGDIVELFEGATQVGTATLTATDITNGYVDITSSTLSEGSLSFTATVTDQTSVANASGASAALSVSLDTTLPTVAITLADSMLTKGETSLVTFTFSEEPEGFANGDVTAENGTLSAVTVDGTDAKIYTATFTPTDNITDSTNVISVGTGYADAAGNTGTTNTSANYEIDTTIAVDTVAPLAPTIDLLAASDTGVSSTDNNTSDTTPTFRVTFDQSGAAGTATVAGDIVKLYEGVTQVGTATLTATDISNGYVEITSSALSAGSLSFTATVTDTSANVSNPSSALAVSLDTTAPTLTVVLADTALIKSETSLVTFTFSEAPAGFANGDVTVANGTLSTVTVDGSDPKIYTATFTPTDNLVDATNTISVSTAYTDGAGNTGTAANSPNYTIDTTDTTAALAPTIDLVAASDLGASNTDNITSDTTPTFRVTFDQSGAATTDTVAGDIVKLVEGVTQVGSATLTATDISNGYVEITSSVLSAGSLSFTATVTDTSANVSNASSALAVSLDTIAPTVTVVLADSDLIKGETSNVTFTFSKDPDGFAVSDVTPANGGLTLFTATADPKVYTALFTPTDNLVDASNIISVSTAYTDAAGNTGTAADSANYTIDTLAPTLSVVLTDTALIKGETSLVTFTFSEAPTGFANGDISIANGTLSTVTVDGSDPKIYTATFTPTDNLVDATNIISVSTAYTDGAGNTGTAASSANYTIDTTDTTAALAPTIDLMAASDLGASSTDNLTSDTTPTFRITFDQSGAATTDTVAGDIVKLVEGVTQVGTATLTATDISNGYVDITSSVLSAGSLSFTVTVTDTSANVSNASSALAVSIDTTAPTLTVVMADTALIKGDTSLVTFTFSEAPTGFANGDFTVANGTLSTVTVDVSDPKIYTALFTPTDNLVDATNIISVSTAYTDGAGNTGTAASSANYTIDTTDTTAALAPSIDLVAASDLGASSTDNLTSDTTPTFRITFDQSGAAATDTVAGDIVKLVEGVTQVGTATLTATDISNGYVDITSSVLSAGSLSFTATVTDTSANVSNASSALAVSIDTTAPTLTAVMADTALIKGETSVVTFTFSEVPSGFANGDVTVDNGTLSTVTVTADPKVYTATFTPTDNLEAATNVIGVNTGYTDAAGNTGTVASSANYTIDTNDTIAPLAPSVDLLAASDTGASTTDNITNDTTPTLRITLDQSGASATDAVVGDVVKLFENGVQVGTATLIATDITNGYVDITSNALTAGSLSFTATVTDQAAVPNVSSASTALPVSLDTTDPSIPTVTSLLTNDTTPTIGGTADDGSSNEVVIAGATYTVAGVGGLWSLDTNVVAPDSGVFALLYGENDVVITSTDAAGNSAVDVSVNEITLTLDDDNDGIPNALECPSLAYDATCLDSDGDGTPDFQDTDSDNDGIPDATEAGLDSSNPIDSDGDGTPDFQDTDSDNDNIDDLVEGTTDSDGDGIPDYVDLGSSGDSDGDGIPDSVECPAYPACPNSDGTGAPDYLDTDSDNDGIDDAVEAGVDPTAPIDTDGDGTPDYKDTDSDEDGSDDAAEGVVDIDGDGIPDYVDVVTTGPGAGDSDGDGIADNIECALYPLCADSDADGTPDYMETDSDNDGISDMAETGSALTDSDVDGIDDTFDIDITSGLTGGLDQNGDGVDDVQPLDTDGDGLPDYQDVDSDGDGINDIVECPAGVPCPDADNDLIPDYLDASNGDASGTDITGSGDSDGDGISDALECATGVPCFDVDQDGLPDYMDNNPDDGPTGDFDSDGLLNYLDPDDDNDNIPDTVEDPNLDGDDNPLSNPLDSDLDGMPDYLDDDSDNDGLSDAEESGASGNDIDGDNIDDTYDVDLTGGNDSNGDGIDDDVTPLDSDGDSLPDYLDKVFDGDRSAIDTDGDGISDETECPVFPTDCPDSDDDGTPDFLETDSDGDGLDDSAETGSLDLGVLLDTDGDGTPDYQDQDSDGDGVSDAIEGLTTDSDGDGIPDALDADSTGAPFGGDSDGDGVPDMDECISYPNCTDSNSDGTPDYMDASSTPYDANTDINTGLKGVGGNGPWSLLLLLSAFMFRRRAVKTSY